MDNNRLFSDNGFPGPLTILIAMNLRQTLSSKIHRKLILIVFLLTLTPMLILGVLLIETGQDATREAVLRDYEEIVKRTAPEIDMMLKTPGDMLKAMASALGVTHADPWKLETALIDLQMNTTNTFTYLIYVDLHGQIQASGTLSYDSMDSMSSMHMQEVLDMFQTSDDQPLYLTHVYFPKEDIPAMTLGIPIKQLGEPVGLLIGQVNLKGIWDVVDGLQIGQTGRAYIVAPKGMVLAHLDKKSIFMAENWRALEPVKQVLAKKTGSLDYQNPRDGDWYLSAFAPLSFDWGIILEQKEEEAYATIKTMRNNAILLMTLSAIGALVIGLFTARSIVKPVLQLVEGTQRISQRDLSHQIELDRSDEIGQLAKSFNTMAQSLKESYDGLEQEVERKTAALPQALEEVKRLNALKSQFVSNVSHELRTPLTSIKGYADTLIRLQDKISSIQRLECAQTISTESARLTRLINNLLDLSRIESGVILLDIVPMDLITLALDAHQAAQPRAFEKSIQIEVHSDEFLPFVLADRDAIRRVFDNLIGNALKYTQEGGLVSISFTLTDTHVYTHVEDNGVGIADEDIQHIFDRFYRIKVPGRQETGTGLGLSIVQSLVEEHHGHISARSTLGEGTVFSFSLPRFSIEEPTYASTETHSRH